MIDAVVRVGGGLVAAGGGCPIGVVSDGLGRPASRIIIGLIHDPLGIRDLIDKTGGGIGDTRHEHRVRGGRYAIGLRRRGNT